MARTRQHLASALLLGAVATSVLVAQQSALQTMPPATARLYQTSLSLIRQGHLAEAQRLLEQAHAQAPANTAVATRLAKLDATLGMPQEAVALFRQVEQVAPGDADNEVNLAIALATTGDMSAALASADRAVALDPASSSAHHIRARALASLDRKLEAKAAFEHALRLSPRDPKLLYDYAVFSDESADYPREIELLQRLIPLAPGNAQAHFLLGRAQDHAGNTAAAEKELAEAVRLDPRNRPALYQLSRLLRASDPAAASAYSDRFRALQASEEELNGIRDQGNAAVAAMSRGDMQSAIPLLRDAVAHCANCSLEAGLQKDLGLALCRSGNIGEGLAALRRSLELDPRDADTLRAIRIAEAAK